MSRRRFGTPACASDSRSGRNGASAAPAAEDASRVRRENRRPRMADTAVAANTELEFFFGCFTSIAPPESERVGRHDRHEQLTQAPIRRLEAFEGARER